MKPISNVTCHFDWFVVAWLRADQLSCFHQPHLPFVTGVPNPSKLG